jgi:diaminopropionate ammonia-lyase
VTLVLNQSSRLEPADAAMLSLEALADVCAYLAVGGDDAPTPLHALPGLAHEASVGAIHVKDEGSRLGLGSFKALGGAYAVSRLVLEEASRRLGRDLGFGDLASPEVRAIARAMTVGCATDGNHGRSVAAGAAAHGARAMIFVHAGVSPDRAAAIARLGGEIVWVEGAYDDAVAEALRRCAAEGWLLVSDTAWAGYERIPGLIMSGYTVLVREALDALPAPPTHVFVQAGVGGLAAAVAGYLEAALGEHRPKIIVVEPALAACLLESAKAGTRVRIAQGPATVMAMLECYEPSLTAWRILSRAADAFMTVDEADAVDIMRRLARPSAGDPAIVAGESGAVGLAGLLRAAADPETRAALGLDAASRVLVINTEGATDPGRYRELVGHAPMGPTGAAAPGG